MIMPIHCDSESDSCKISTAPINVHIGAEERMGDTMEMGRYFIAKKTHIHEESTIMLFKKISNWSCNDVNGIKKIESSKISGLQNERKNNGTNSIKEERLENSNTSKTALSLTEIFLKIS